MSLLNGSVLRAEYNNMHSKLMYIIIVYCMKILFIRSPYQTIDVQKLHINKMQTYLQKLKIISREKLDGEYLQILFF